MASAMTPLATYTFSAADSDVIFSNIPNTDVNGNTIRDLVVTFHGSFGVNRNLALRFNGDSTGSYDSVSAYGRFDSTPVSGETRNATYIYATYYQIVANEPGVASIDIFDAKVSGKRKAVITKMGSAEGSGSVELNFGKWNNTEPITSVQVHVNSFQNFNAGSTVNLYGIAG